MGAQSGSSGNRWGESCEPWVSVEVEEQKTESGASLVGDGRLECAV